MNFIESSFVVLDIVFNPLELLLSSILLFFANLARRLSFFNFQEFFKSCIQNFY